jgi:hypothetical protein
MCEDFAPNFGDKRTSSFITTTHRLRLPHKIILFPRLKTKVKNRHYDTVEVIEAESQSVLNNLTLHDFEDGFKNGRH